MIKTKNPDIINLYQGLVPGAGIEPARACAHKILSLACLPVSPSRHIVEGGSPLTISKNKDVTHATSSLFGAKDGVRTRDLDLGKVALYQLSYFRVFNSAVLVAFCYSSAEL